MDRAFLGLILLTIGLALFLLPAWLARGRPNADRITLLNVLFGATIAGWVAALLWALYERGVMRASAGPALQKAVAWLQSWKSFLGLFASFVFLLIYDYKAFKHAKVFEGHPMCLELVVFFILAAVLFKVPKWRVPLSFTISMAIIIFTVGQVHPGPWGMAVLAGAFGLLAACSQAGEDRADERKILNAALLLGGVVFIFLFFLVKAVGGDIGNILWRLTLTQFHLAREWAMPYFTPVHCAGFHLAADAQDFIFTIYMLAAFVIPNSLWAVKLANCLLSLVLGWGVCVLLRYFAIFSVPARLFSSLLIVMCGYWVGHIAEAGELWAHGLAYLPWLLILMEELFKADLRSGRRLSVQALGLTGLFFLIINSGYYWLQVAAPIIVLRVIVEGVLCGGTWKTRVLKIGVIAAAFAGALLLSFPRLAAVYEFQLKKFPRLGGEVAAFQVIGGRKWLEIAFGSFFDGSIIREAKWHEVMGGFHEYTNFIGLAAVVPLAWGLWHCRRQFQNRLFITLVLAALVQLAFTQGEDALSALRHFFPLFKQIGWVYRGSAIVLLLAAVLIALGYEAMLSKGKRGILYGVALLMALNIAEIVYAQAGRMDFKTWPAFSEIAKEDPPVPYPADRAWTPCLLGYVYGYGNERPPVLSAQVEAGSSFYVEPRPGFYNVHDVRVLGSCEADGGRFLNEKWPLWAKDDSPEEFDKFIHYQQVVALPEWLKTGNLISGIAWGGFAATCLFVFLPL